MGIEVNNKPPAVSTTWHLSKSFTRRAGDFQGGSDRWNLFRAVEGFLSSLVTYRWSGHQQHRAIWDAVYHGQYSASWSRIFIFKQEALRFKSIETHWCRVWVSVSDAVIECHDQKRLKEGLFLAHGSGGLASTVAGEAWKQARVGTSYILSVHRKQREHARSRWVG